MFFQRLSIVINATEFIHYATLWGNWLDGPDWQVGEPSYATDINKDQHTLFVPNFNLRTVIQMAPDDN